MTVPVTLCIDWLGRPILSNKVMRAQPAQRHRLTTDWREAGIDAARVYKLRPFAAVILTAQARYHHAGSLPDTSAIDPSVKALVDGLVDAAVLPGDTGDVVRSITYLAAVVDRTRPDALLVTIEAADTEGVA